MAVVLSGTGVDGSIGIAAVKERGGTVIAQDGAEFGGMPAAAVATGIVDRIVPLERIAPVICEVLAHGVMR